MGIWTPLDPSQRPLRPAGPPTPERRGQPCGPGSAPGSPSSCGGCATDRYLLGGGGVAPRLPRWRRGIGGWRCGRGPGRATAPATPHAMPCGTAGGRARRGRGGGARGVSQASGTRGRAPAQGPRRSHRQAPAAPPPARASPAVAGARHDTASAAGHGAVHPRAHGPLRGKRTGPTARSRPTAHATTDRVPRATPAPPLGLDCADASHPIPGPGARGDGCPPHDSPAAPDSVSGASVFVPVARA